MFTEDQLLPLSALQHWLYCPRQCGLIHLEQAWAENKFTAEGQMLHKKAHEGEDESKAGVRITRSMAVRSLALGISGECDIVEFHNAGGDLKFEISDLKGRASGTEHEASGRNLRSQISDLKFETPGGKLLPPDPRLGGLTPELRHQRPAPSERADPGELGKKEGLRRAIEGVQGERTRNDGESSARSSSPHGVGATQRAYLTPLAPLGI